MKSVILVQSILTLLLVTTMQAAPPLVENIPTQDILRHWRNAVVRSDSGAQAEAELSVSSNEDGVAAVIHEHVSSQGDFHALISRTLDTSEVTVVHGIAQERDWNGFLRTLRGRELGRLKAAIAEQAAVLFGPPKSVPEASRVQSAGDSLYSLRLTAADAETTIWWISTRTWLPVKSARPGEEEDIVTRYGDWREVRGRMVPFRGEVEEPEKPAYIRTITGVSFAGAVSEEHFQFPSPGPSDAYLDPAAALPIPFNFENSHIIFPLSINGKDSVLFLLDTGANEEVINEAHVDEYHLQPYGSTMTTGGGGTASYRFARGATFRLPGVEVRNQHVAIIDETGLERALGMKLGGLLGYDFISRFVVEIDYMKQVLVLHDAATWNYAGAGYVVPVTFDLGIPYCDALISVPGKPSIPAYMVLDFGAAETMTLTSPFVKANDILRLAGTNMNVNKLAGLENQFFSQNNVRGHIDKLAAGGLVVESFPANLSVNTKGAYASTKFAGTIGQGIDRRYHVFLDYARDRIIFEPTPETEKPFPERKTYGLTILASGEDLHTFTVTAVRPGSPAEKDGFVKGDVVTGLDEKPSARFTLGELRDRLSHEHEHHVVSVKRGADAVNIAFDVRLISLEKQ